VAVGDIVLFSRKKAGYVAMVKSGRRCFLATNSIPRLHGR
jgi:hypothetical protein